MCLGCKGIKYFKRIKKIYKKILRVNVIILYKLIGDSMSFFYMDVSFWLVIFNKEC